MNKGLSVKKVASLCISLSLLVACGPDANAPVAANQVTTSQAAVQQNGQSMNLSDQARVALAAYHEVDASFSDSARFAQRGQFSTQLLDLDIVDDVLGDDDDDSSTDTDASADASAGADIGVDVDGDDNDSSLDVGVDADASASVDDDASFDAGVNADANLDDDASVNAGVGASANADLDDSDKLNLGSSLSTDINADVDSSFEEMNRAATDLRTQLEATGNVNIDDDGNASIHSDNLKLSVDGAIDAELDNLTSAETDSDSNSSVALNAGTMARLSSRNMQGSLTELSSNTHADGSVTSMFNVKLENDDSTRDITFTSRNDGELQLGSDFVLSESGSGFERDASRISSLQGDGTVKVMTRSTTTLGDGDTITIFEERFTDLQGNGTGNGTLTIETAEGEIESFDLRTMAKADGSLTTFLDSDDASSDLMLREDAAGNASLSVIGGDREELDRVNIDFQSMLEATNSTDFDF